MNSFSFTYPTLSFMFSCMGIKVTVKPLKGHPLYNYRVFYPDGDKRRTKNFKLKREAENWAREKTKKLSQTGIADTSITKDERRAVIRFRDAIASMDVEAIPLSRAVDHFLEHLSLNFKPLTCDEVADALVHRLESEGKSKRHIDSTRSRLKRWSAEYGDRKTRDISTEIVDDFLMHMQGSPKTVSAYRLTLSALFAHAVRLKAAQSNPVAESMRPKVPKVEPGTLKPKQVAAMLHAASDRYLPALAISFFAGLRSSEIEELNWREIDFDEGHIEIKAAISKKEKRRFVPISDNLRAWLLPHRQAEGALIDSPQIHRTEREAAQAKAGIKNWPHNAGRHSYASYHIAEFQDAGKTSFNLGHPNPTLLYNTYRALVKPKDAHAYWGISPVPAKNITNIKAS